MGAVRSLITQQHVKLKPLLMDQKFLAGIGNIYSDEILWGAGLRWDRIERLALAAGGPAALSRDGRDAAGRGEVPRARRSPTSSTWTCTASRASTSTTTRCTPTTATPVAGAATRSCASATAAGPPTTATLARSRARRLAGDVWVQRAPCQNVWFRDRVRAGSDRAAMGVDGLGAQPRRRSRRGRASRARPAPSTALVAWCHDGPPRARVTRVEVEVTRRLRGLTEGTSRHAPEADRGMPASPRRQRGDASRTDRATMFLKSLTLKGFKSFAEKTTLDFEPGVTVVVGPNGSGKSNLVDAVAWVLGAQGPRTLRSGKMDDVIFAGTPQRQALGRCEVTLTIDNTARPAADRLHRGDDHAHAVPHRRVASTSSTTCRAGCSTSRSCSPTPASVASST